MSQRCINRGLAPDVSMRIRIRIQGAKPMRNHEEPDPDPGGQINADPWGSGTTTLLDSTDLADAVGGGADPDQRGELLLPSRRFLSQRKLFKDYKLNKNAVFCPTSVANRLKFWPQSHKI
jgi:hypothetical protein